ncbi:MAG: hypothetical protein ACYDAE_05085 [Steroidobacteraceae bacterium]
MDEGYSVKLVARNEGIEYRDEHDVYRFNLRLTNKTWTVSLPGSKGRNYQPHELTDEEQSVVLARVKAYLERRKYFGFVGPSYPVIFEREGPVSTAIAEGRMRASKYFDERDKADRR